MGLLLTFLVLEGVLLYSLNKIKLSEQQVIDRWRKGELSYEDVLLLRKSRYYLLRKLNPKVKFGRIELFKKDD